MYKLCVFAGTTEGRKLASFLSGQENVTATICVATDYGEQLISPSDNITVSSKRLTKDEMKEFFVNEGFCLVIDATHPYAAVVTENISSACAETGTEYIRLLRENSGVALCGDVFYASDTEAAAEFLAGTDGNILLTTGSKEIAKYSSIPGFADRVFARVLPMDSSLKACSDAGLKPANILAIQGPFSEEMNISMLRFTNAKYLVTKDGGSAGGFGEKMSACLRENVCAVIIGRPPQLEGLSFGETIRRLCSRFGLKRRPHVSVVGIGPGNKENMTVEVLKAVEQAQCLIGAERMLSAVASPSQMTIEAIAPSAIAKAIEEETEFFDFSVVMSGDSGFFSGTKKLLPLLSECEVSVLPGISSLSYLCSRTGESYEDVKLVSTHGRDHNIVADVRRNGRVFTLVGGENGAGKLCRTLCEAGLGDVTVCVGSKLSYPDEKITRGKASELSEMVFDSLSAVIIINPAPLGIVTHGLPDEVFRRGEGEGGVVPMTKMEVRSVSLSCLQLSGDSVCWDVGAGTGSVSIELALQAEKGHVYAIERKPSAVELLRLNKERFGAENMTIIEGLAPEACEALPAPTHVFIGGSSGNMKEIISLILSKNPCARIVANAVTIESVAEINACMKEFDFTEQSVISLSTARARKLGSYNLMTGLNPVYIFTMQKQENSSL